MAMEKLILQHVNDMERIRLLEDNAHRVIENHEYDYVLSFEEITEEEHDYSVQSIEITRLEEEKTALMKELNDNLKLKKELAAKTLEIIRSGRDRVTEKCFVLEDDSTGYQGIYNVKGQLISETPPRPGQTRSLFRIGASSGDGSKEEPFQVKVG